MRTYLAVTAALFGLLTLLHLWRAAVEPSSREPWFVGITVLSALLCVWGVRLFLTSRSPSEPRTS